MLEILLLILKVLALILLCIIGLVIALVILLMIFPVCYHVFVSYESQLVCRVTVLGIQLYPKKERRKFFRRKNSKNTPINDAGQSDCVAKETDFGQEHEQTATLAAETIQSQEKTLESNSKNKYTKKTKTAQKKTKKQRQKKKSNLKDTLTRIHAEFTDTANQQALRHIGKELLFLLRHCGPRRVKADAVFSLGDPANTGYVTAALSVCPFAYKKRCLLSPDFETEQLYIRGWVDVRGHVQLFFPMVSGLRLLMDKNIRSVLQKLQHQKK